MESRQHGWKSAYPNVRTLSFLSPPLLGVAPQAHRVDVSAISSAARVELRYILRRHRRHYRVLQKFINLLN